MNNLLCIICITIQVFKTLSNMPANGAQQYHYDVSLPDSKWKTEIGKMSNNNNYAYASSIGQLPGGYAGSTISTTSIADSKVTIDDGENGSMRVDVPLVVDGRDVMKEIDEMRDALLLLKRDVDMEAKYPRLKEIKDEYEAALAKYTTFDTLKESK